MINSWNEMPIGVFEEIREISGLHCSDDEKEFRTAALIMGISYDEFINLPLTEARDAVQHTYSIVKIPPKKEKVKREYKIGDHTYVLFRDFTKMTTAQYIDFQSLMSKDENIGELLSIALIPKGCEYGEGYDKEDVIEEIRNGLNVGEALGIVDFFMLRCKRSMTLQMLKAQATITTARIMSKGTEKKLLRATEKLINLKAKELRQGLGYNWRNRWPK